MVEKSHTSTNNPCCGQVLAGKKVIVSAGPTYEYLDAVTFLGTASSGKMGFSLACAARDAGAQVVLVTGPVALEDPDGIEVLHTVSAQDMRDAVFSRYDNTDIVIMAAAVTDFRPAHRSDIKVKKAEQADGLRLVPTPDILAELGAQKGDRFLCGFAAETHDLSRYAKEKLKKKNLDIIVANDVSMPGAGFGTDTNIVTAYYGDGSKAFPIMSKTELAHQLIDLISELLKS